LKGRRPLCSQSQESGPSKRTSSPAGGAAPTAPHVSVLRVYEEGLRGCGMQHGDNATGQSQQAADAVKRWRRRLCNRKAIKQVLFIMAPGKRGISPPNVHPKHRVISG